MMTEEDILKGIKEYFGIYEFVDKRTYDTWGEKAWMFLDVQFLYTILIIREEIDKPMYFNTWKWGGPFQQRGLRTNVSYIVKAKTGRDKLYLSAHPMGKAGDFDVKGMTAEETRDWILARPQLFPYKIRLEHLKKDTKKGSPTFGKMIPITWVHLDLFFLLSNPDIYLFNV